MTYAPLAVEETRLPGVLVVRPRVHPDERGFFVECFNQQTFRDAGLPVDFVQDNHSRSSTGVLRGLHYQRTTGQGKLVRVARGSIFDVAADVRVGSPTFGKWVGVTLDDATLSAIWIPPGFAHGFCVLSEVADVVYKCTALYAPDDEYGVVWNDPDLAIEWPVKRPRLSARDAALPRLAAHANLPRLGEESSR